MGGVAGVAVAIASVVSGMVSGVIWGAGFERIVGMFVAAGGYFEVAS